jgi:hypothetical protein
VQSDELADLRTESERFEELWARRPEVVGLQGMAG